MVLGRLGVGGASATDGGVLRGAASDTTDMRLPAPTGVVFQY